MNQAPANREDSGILREEVQEIHAEEPDDGREKEGRECGEREGDAEALKGAFYLSCAVVLSHEGRNRNAEGIDDHPEQHIHLAVGCDCGNGVGAEAVDGRLHNDIRNGIHGALQTGRETDINHFFEPAEVHAEFPRVETHFAVRVEQDIENHNRRSRLREYGCECSARDAHVERDHEDQVEHNVAETA